MTSLDQFKADFGSKSVLVLGLGLLGGGAKLVNFLDLVGCKITISDQKNKQELSETLENIQNKDIKLSLGSHNLEDLKGIDLIIRNPGVPKDHQMLTKAKDLGIPIYLETALFAKYTNKPVIGITGTRGKTTTATLIHHILCNSDKKTILSGNIPNTCALSLLETESQENYWGTVLELSSWQLQGFDDLKVSPDYAILTNVYQDHLNRYESMDEYASDKAIISKHQKEDNHLIFNGQNKIVSDIAESSKAKKYDFSKYQLDQKEVFSLIGEHNQENLKASLQLADLLKIPKEVVSKSLSTFHPVPFRLEPVKVIDGVTYINDTTSTTPIALEVAIKSMSTETILIMGGNSKNLSIDSLIEVLNKSKKLKNIILIPGSGSDEIRSLLKEVIEKETLDEAIEHAHSIAKPGDTILFSPGFTSFSQFKNEFDRGQHFNQVVSKL